MKDKKKSSGYWKQWEHVQQRVLDIIGETDILPSGSILREEGHSDILSAIERYYGGLNSVRLRLGLSQSHTSSKLERHLPGYWQQWQNVKRELEEVIEQQDHFPTQSELDSLGKQSLRSAITSYHGGFRRARKLFGYKPLPRRKITRRVPPRYWKDWSHVESALREMTDSLGHFPTTTEMRCQGYVGLPNALYDYHGGLGNVRERIERDADMPTEKNQLENLLTRYIES